MKDSENVGTKHCPEWPEILLKQDFAFVEDIVKWSVQAKFSFP